MRKSRILETPLRVRQILPGATLIGSMLLAMMSPVASASVNMVIFEGTVETVGTGISGEFTPGEPITGYFLYETTTAPEPISSGDQAWYDAISLDYRIGDYSGSDSTPYAPSDGIFVWNDISTRDVFALESQSPSGTSVGGLAPEKFRVQLHDPTATVFADSSLPAAIDLADFDTTNTSLSFITLTFGTSPGTNNQVRGRIDTLTVAPPKLVGEFTGSVVSVGAGISSAFAAGESISGKFTYDPTTPEHALSTSDQAWYDAVRLRYRIGSYHGADPTPLSASDGLRVVDDMSGADRFSIGSNSPLGSPVAGLAPNGFRFQLNDPTASVFSDVSLPTALALDDFDATNTSLSYITLTFGAAPGTANQVRGQVTSLTLTPVGDADRDGVFDDVDNCLEVSNPGQRDTDSDGIGNRCDADLNNDCAVNVVDLGILKSVFFTAHPHADLSGDGTVNVFDLGIMKSLFFGAPGPSCAANICE